MSKHFAVMGNPIQHSRSPELHQAFAIEAGIALDYQKILASLDNFEEMVKDFFAQGGDGLNITVPFKERAFALCDVLSERASIAQAVNTLWQHDGQLYGDNTDGQGLVAALNALDWSLKAANILILGAGGATRGVILPLAQAGVASISIANRTLSRAEQLINDVQTFVPSTPLKAIDLTQLAGEFDLVINATSASLAGDALILPAQLQIHHAYEMAYGKPSSFIEQAKARDIPHSDGFSMLVGQAIEAFSLWHGVNLTLSEFLD